jgi:hypothetical protein
LRNSLFPPFYIIYKLPWGFLKKNKSHFSICPTCTGSVNLLKKSWYTTILNISLHDHLYWLRSFWFPYEFCFYFSSNCDMFDTFIVKHFIFFVVAVSSVY